jgi:hypothetical protein
VGVVLALIFAFVLARQIAVNSRDEIGIVSQAFKKRPPSSSP